MYLHAAHDLEDLSLVDIVDLMLTTTLFAPEDTRYDPLVLEAQEPFLGRVPLNVLWDSNTRNTRNSTAFERAFQLGEGLHLRFDVAMESLVLLFLRGIWRLSESLHF